MRFTDFSGFKVYVGEKLDADLNVHTGGEVQLLELVNRAGCRVNNVQESLVSTNLELLCRLLVDVGRAVDAELLDTSRKRNGSSNLGAGALGCVHNLNGRLLENSAIISAKANPDLLVLHDVKW
jgi:hypothetical protein